MARPFHWAFIFLFYLEYSNNDHIQNKTEALKQGKLKMNSNLLLAKVVAKGHDRKKLANILGISYWSVCQKLTNKYEFTHREMSNIIKEYDLTAEEIKEIFFN